MLLCVRTTINLDDEVFRAYKTRAAQRGTTLAREVEDVLRSDLHRHDASDPTEPFAFPVVDGELLPGVDYTSNAALAELMEEPEANRRR